MFIDWLKIYQEHEMDAPFLTDRASIIIDTETSEQLGVRQAPLKHPGSFCTSIQIQVTDTRITISGNPSRYGRVDNLFGFESIDECVSVYNRILRSLDLPEFTKCTEVYRRSGKEGTKVQLASNGAVIQELHITSNKSVGQGCEADYLKGLATQRYRNSLPRLHTNGMTVDWLSKLGNARFIYPSVYVKYNEMLLHSADKLKRSYGEGSKEFGYLNKVIGYCRMAGVVRFEQKLKSAFLRKSNFCFWGLFDEEKLKPIHEHFVGLDKRLSVEKMTIENIAEKLVRKKIVKSTHAANVTSMYAIQWMNGTRFDLAKTQVQTHRARLRQIGIDIANPCDINRHSPVFVRETKTIDVQDLSMPSWYQRPGVANLRLVA